MTLSLKLTLKHIQRYSRCFSFEDRLHLSQYCEIKEDIPSGQFIENYIFKTYFDILVISTNCITYKTKKK